jgi:hypothetical protein
MFDATSSINDIPWNNAPKSDSGLRAFARRHDFYPTEATRPGKWWIAWSSYGDFEEYDTAIEAIRAEVNYHRR